MTVSRGIALVALVALSGCDLFGPDEVLEITALPRNLTVNEQAVIENGNAFGLELLQTVVAEDSRPNIVLSPLSASIALGMTLNGAAGTTFDAMRSTLGLSGLSQPEINASYTGLMELLTTLDPSVTFEIANAVWANEEVTFEQAFLAAVADGFSAHMESSNFADPATVQAINDWADQSTNGLIDKIIDSLDPMHVMVLLNAIYFEAVWKTEFDPADTRDELFFLPDTAPTTVEMMTVKDAEFPRYHGGSFQAVELPYGGGAFAMIVVVPERMTARELVATLDETMWAEIVDGLEPSRLDYVSIPKVTLTYDTYLNDALQQMGMEEAFYPGADFTAMSPIGHRLCIDFVRQKTFLEVDERGTRAAAVTAVGIQDQSLSAVVADRPYIVAIRERLSGTIIFVGLIGDPNAVDPGALPFNDTCQ